MFPSQEDLFEIIKKFVSEKTLISHQIESYDYLLEYHLQKIFDDIPTIHLKPKNTLDIYIKFGQVYVDFPTTPEDSGVPQDSVFTDKKDKRLIYPSECRLRDLIYESSVWVDITERIVDTDNGTDVVNFHSKIWIADIPQMLGSCRCNIAKMSIEEKIAVGECEKDLGGYFIIKGNERVLVGQERINYNQIYIFDQKNKLQKWTHVAEIRSISEETSHSVLVQAKCTNDGRVLVFSLPYIKIEVPAGIVFKALGFDTYHQIFKILGGDTKFSKFIEWILRSGQIVSDQMQALEWIGANPIHNTTEEKKRVDYATQVLGSEIFPHLNPSTPLDVANCLGNMVAKLLYTVLGVRKYDDRDNISLKRVETAGILVGDLFRMNLKKTIEIIKKNISKKPDFIACIGQNTITNNIRYCFSTGNWGVQKNAYIRTGVSQVLSRLTFSATLSHLRRLIIPNAKESKNTKTRQLHPTQAFFVCPCESPDGQTIGIVKNLALSARITQPSNTIVLRDMVENYGKYIIFDLDTHSQPHPLAKILINGIMIGYTPTP